jgi:hypothetical protein
MRSNVRVVDGDPPIVLELDDGETHISVRLSLDELNELGNSAAEALNGHRGEILDA